MIQFLKVFFSFDVSENGYWDHIVPEEGDKAGKIDCYECQVCDKKFKNALEKAGPGSSAGRGSAICHVATGNFFQENFIFEKYSRLLISKFSSNPQIN